MIIKYSIYCQMIIQSGPITLELVRNLTQYSNKKTVAHNINNKPK